MDRDESFWLILSLPEKTVAPIAIEAVQPEIESYATAGLTIMETITASGAKLPLFLIAKGLTPRCHEQFGDITNRFSGDIAHFHCGWMTQPVFVSYLSFLGLQVADGATCLILDQSPTHLTDGSDGGSQIGVRLIKVPNGLPGFGSRWTDESMGQ